MKKKPIIILFTIGIVITAVVIWWKAGRWSTVCTSRSPDGTLFAEVRCHWMPAAMDGRYHYYLSFEPKREFRPISEDSYVTVKISASAVKNDQVVYTWKTEHYVGYLQGFDGVDERRPSSIQWETDGTVVLLSQRGIAGKYEFRN